jgi:hypothetical protein|tara:strand:- start:344 stop:610 length:267 start_codon:yes stop_codon:yes gene_type:complete
MQKVLFDKKAEQMGDFHIYYQKRDSNVVTFAVCTIELDIPYIQERMRNMKPTDGEVLLWNWRYNSPLRIPYDKIKKLTPLSAVLKNDR